MLRLCAGFRFSEGPEKSKHWLHQATAHAAAAVLAIRSIQLLRLLLVQRSGDQRPGASASCSGARGIAAGGRIRSEEDHPITGSLIASTIRSALETWRRKTRSSPPQLCWLFSRCRVWKLGSEFMPPLDEALCSTCQPPSQASPSANRRSSCGRRTHSEELSGVDHSRQNRRVIPQLTLRPLSMLETSSCSKPQSGGGPSRSGTPPGRRLSCCRPYAALPPTTFHRENHGQMDAGPQNPGPFNA